MRAMRRMHLNLARVPGIELAIEERMKQNFGFGAAHVDVPSSAIHAFRSMDRARAKRDITVPTGTPITSNVAIGQIVDFAQDNRLPKRLGKLSNETADCLCVPWRSTSVSRDDV